MRARFPQSSALWDILHLDIAQGLSIGRWVSWKGLKTLGHSPPHSKCRL